MDPFSWLMEYISNCSSLYAVALLAMLAATVWFFLEYRAKKGGKGDIVEEVASEEESKNRKFHLNIFYGSQTGTAKRCAEKLAMQARIAGIECDTRDLKDCDPEETLIRKKSTCSICVFIISTYTDGSPPEPASWFCQWLSDTACDFRVPKTFLSGLHYTVFGLGDSQYGENYNKVGKGVFDWLEQLSAAPVFPLGLGDQNVAESKNGGVDEDFEAWKKAFAVEVFPVLEGRKSIETLEQQMTVCDSTKCACKSSDGPAEAATCCKHRSGGISAKDGEQAAEELCETSSDDEEGGGSGGEDIMDLEDMGKAIKKGKSSKDLAAEPKEMVTPQLRETLTKQGYRVIGSHSGVKLCRWTKSMLRGRGGCYKHTFYGIESHRCMEATPSLACANKCVFCWRHHTNPVGTEWHWKTDNADDILTEALENHYQMIKQFRGVPGVQADKLAEGMAVQHCALSLVGEPIMYPKINDLVHLLHQKKISTFLVTNAQFPDAIRALTPVTQLYVSVDAGSKEDLKRIDRPLFRDFWQRYLDSLEALGQKSQRTVYRLTLVKDWNVDQLEGYASLVKRGDPDFIEVKGVTYCGESKASTLTMVNVPWHEEVMGFVKQFVDLLSEYEVACEHEHSNCVLIAHKRFKVEGRWHTWIDYTKFHQLIERYEASGGKETFTSQDYMAPSPDWAVVGHPQHGFDPQETRWHRKNKKEMGGC